MLYRKHGIMQVIQFMLKNHHSIKQVPILLLTDQ